MLCVDATTRAPTTWLALAITMLCLGLDPSLDSALALLALDCAAHLGHFGATCAPPPVSNIEAWIMGAADAAPYAWTVTLEYDARGPMPRLPLPWPYC